MDKVRFIVTPSILAQCNILSSNSFEIADTETKAAPKPE